MLSLRLRLPSSNETVNFEVVESTPWTCFLFELENRSGIQYDKIRVLGGYPPKPIVAADDTPVNTLFRRGDLLFLQEGPATVVKGFTDGRYVPPANDKWHFTRRICPSDNSCLFHAAAYVLRDKSRVDGLKLREECAQTVLTYPDMFNEVLLERPNFEYAQWIRRPTSWGGAIELLILSFLSQTEIVTLDLESFCMERFGQDRGYTVRAFVVYTGKHYDAIAMNAMFNSPREHEDQVLFSASDDHVIERATRFVREEAERCKQKKM